MKNLILMLCCALSFSLKAQETQDFPRTELPIQMITKGKYSMYEFGRKGAFVISRKMLNVTTIKHIEIKFLDTNLTIVKDTNILGQDENGQYRKAFFINQTSSKDAVYILFGIKKGITEADYAVFKIQPNGEISEIPLNFPDEITPYTQLSSFRANNEYLNFIISEKENNVQTTHFYSFDTKLEELKITDISSYKGNELESSAILSNHDKNIFILIGNQSNGNETKIICRPINEYGELEAELPLNISIEGCVSDLQIAGYPESFIISGSLYKNCNRVAGKTNQIFFALFKDGENVFTSIKTLNEFECLFSSANQKSQEQRSKKAIKINQNPILMLDEKFMLSFNHYKTYNENGGPVQIEYLNTLLFEINEEGEVLNHHCISYDLKNSYTPILSQCEGAVYISKPNSMLMAPVIEIEPGILADVLFISKIQNGKIDYVNKTFAVTRLPNTINVRDDKLRLIHWYENYFLLSGIHMGKKIEVNSENKKSKKTKFKSFYLEKIDIRVLESRPDLPSVN